MIEIREEMSLNELKSILKEKINNITLEELYDLSYHFNEDTKYLPREYHKKYTESVLNVIMNRFIILKNDSKHYKGKLPKGDMENINKLLECQEDKTKYILNILAVYATYILNEPIHLPKTTFPGLVSINFDGKDYYCPVKKYQIKNDNALCKYCIAKKSEG